MDKKILASCGIIIAAITLIIVGIVTGQNANVYTKAIRICLECVGIG